MGPFTRDTARRVVGWARCLRRIRCLLKLDVFSLWWSAGDNSSPDESIVCAIQKFPPRSGDCGIAFWTHFRKGEHWNRTLRRNIHCRGGYEGR